MATESVIANNTDVPVVYDHHYLGGVNDQGEVYQEWGEDALKNAIKMWVASFKGEVIRKPNRGGYITRWLLRPMQGVDVADVKMAIRNGINQDFSPLLILERLEVVANLSGRRWEIYMEVYSPDLKTRTVVSEHIKAQV